MSKKKISGGTFKHIEGELHAYHHTLEEIERIKKDIVLSTGSHDNIGGGKTGMVSDPTGQSVATILTHKRIIHLEEITHAIQVVYDGLPPEKQKLMRLLYWTKPKEYTWEGIANQLHVSKRQAQRWRNKIVETIAKRLGWR